VSPKQLNALGETLVIFCNFFNHGAIFIILCSKSAILK
jgi:hypothetical protein